MYSCNLICVVILSTIKRQIKDSLHTCSFQFYVAFTHYTTALHCVLQSCCADVAMIICSWDKIVHVDVLIDAQQQTCSRLMWQPLIWPLKT